MSRRSRERPGDGSGSAASESSRPKAAGSEPARPKAQQGQRRWPAGTCAAPARAPGRALPAEPHRCHHQVQEQPCRAGRCPVKQNLLGCLPDTDAQQRRAAQKPRPGGDKPSHTRQHRVPRPSGARQAPSAPPRATRLLPCEAAAPSRRSGPPHPTDRLQSQAPASRPSRRAWQRPPPS